MNLLLKIIKNNLKSLLLKRSKTIKTSNAENAKEIFEMKGVYLIIIGHIG